MDPASADGAPPERASAARGARTGSAPAAPIYLDNHATTAVDPRVVEVMVECFRDAYGNPGSVSHPYGWAAKERVDAARESIARGLGVTPREIIFTSGATESNNLALKGLAEQPRRRGGHLVSVRTEHKAVLDPLARLGRRGCEITLLEVAGQDQECPGWLDPQRVADALRDDTLAVSVMLANNEIGVLQPIAEIAAVCHARGVPLHCDATQAVAKLPLDLAALDADLVSFSAHKFHGPKGVGALVVRRRSPRLRLEPQLDGGGQEQGLRSGTLNVPGIVGMARALELSLAELPTERPRLRMLRDRLWERLVEEVPGVRLHGPPLDDRRLDGSLNCGFPGVDGEALMMSVPELGVSSGSACTSANPEPSHVLRALGIEQDLIRASLRFGLGRFNTEAEIDFAVEALAREVSRLRRLLP